MSMKDFFTLLDQAKAGVQFSFALEGCANADFSEESPA